MKRALLLATALVVISPVGAAMASESSWHYAPGSANSPMHPERDAAKDFRVLERGHITRDEPQHDLPNQ
jgi:hypothetical protein